MKIHRSQIKEDLIKLFSDQAVMQEQLEFKILADNGKAEEGQGSGVKRDMFATFWQEIFTSLTVGSTEKVPCIRHDYQRKEWESIARILVFGFQCSGYFPISLSPLFLTVCVHGEEAITKEELLDSFMQYVTSDEKDVLQKCLAGDLECDDEDLLDVLSSYKCYKLPTKTNLDCILTELAHQELIQKPRYVGECWGPILRSLSKTERFSSLNKLKEFFLLMKPNAKKVIKTLKPRINQECDQQSFEFLKKFIKSLDPASLKIFLKFVTGSDVLVCDSIDVAFTLSDGFERRPVAHTCSPLLEVPATYQSYSELTEEFNNILRNKEAWTFNIV